LCEQANHNACCTDTTREILKIFFARDSEIFQAAFHTRRFNGLHDDALTEPKLRPSRLCKMQNRRLKKETPSSRIRRRRFVVWKIFAREELRAKLARSVRP
jgi:hypothetical protein